ncbi:hypothetical protein ACFL05_00695 [Patescibacteria group bacterium]
MPNIFICGFEKEKAEELKKFIDETMKGLCLQDDAITSIVETRPESCDGSRKPMPHLWVRSTKENEVIVIIDAFKKRGLKLDLEWDVIGGFIPAEELSDDFRPNNHKNCEGYGSIEHMQSINKRCPSCGKL